MRRLLLALLFAVLLAAHSFAADAPSYHISGRLVDAITAQPVAAAQLNLGLNGEYDKVLQKQLTSDDGQFDFTVPAGKFWLNAESANHYLQSFEQHTPYASAIVTGPGQESTGIVFRLHPSAHLDGRIADDEGEAVANADVYLFRSDVSAGFPQIVAAREGKTDALGEYRFTNLESGRYYLVVSARPWFAQAVIDTHAPGSDLPSDLRRLMDTAYPTTIYPGVFDEDSAAPIDLHEGEEATANLSLMAVPAAQVRVRGILAAGSDFVSDTLTRRIFNFSFAPVAQSPGDDGVRVFNGVPVGRYSFSMQEQRGDKASPTRYLTIDVVGDTEADASAARPAALRGTVSNRGALAPQAFIRLWNAKTSRLYDQLIDDHGHFEFPTAIVEPGSYSVFVFGRLYSSLQRMSARGAKVAGQSLIVSDGKPIDLQLEICEHLATVTGFAALHARPTAGLMVVLVPDDPEHNLPLFRRDQTDSDGSFELHEIVPGHYRLVAMEDGWTLGWVALAQAKAATGPVVEVTVPPDGKLRRNIAVQ